MEINTYETEVQRFTQLDERDGAVAHKDIGSIDEYELLQGYEVINRTKSGISPFTPIQKVPSYTTNGNLTGYGIEIEEEGSMRLVGNVSKNYLLVPNADMMQVAEEVANKAPWPTRPARLFWDGARFAAVLAFSEGVEIEQGDDVGLALVFRNSYNGAWASQVSLMGRRFVCDNGVLSGEFFASCRFKHTQSSRGWEELVGQSMAIVEQADTALGHFANQLRRLKQMPATHENMAAAVAALAPMGPQWVGKIVSRFYAEEEPTLYGLLNAGTYETWHDAKFTASNLGSNALIFDTISKI